MQRLLLAFALSLPATTTACGTTCDREVDGEEIRFENGIVDDARTTYRTSEPEGPLLHFPTGRRFVLVHGLRARPLPPQTWVAFQERPIPRTWEGGVKNNLSQSAGNQAVIEAVDEEVIVVRNDTCAEFFLLVVAMTAGGADADAGGGAADAAGE